MLGTVDRAAGRSAWPSGSRTATRAALFDRVAAIDEFAPDYGQLLDELARAAAAGRAAPGRARARPTTRSMRRDARGARGAHAGGGRAALLPDRDPRPARPRSRARPAHRLRDDAAAHARVPARGSRRRPRRRGRSGRRRRGAGAPQRAVPQRARQVAAPRPRRDDWPTLLGRAGTKGRRGSSRATASCCRARATHFRFLLDERAQRAAHAPARGRFVQALRALRRRAGDRRDRAGRRRRHAGTPRRAGARTSALEQARAALERDPNVQALRDRFGAVLQPDSIKPVGVRRMRA